MVAVRDLCTVVDIAATSIDQDGRDAFLAERDLYRETALDIVETTKANLQDGLARMRMTARRQRPNSFANEKMDETYLAILSAIEWVQGPRLRAVAAILDMDTQEVRMGILNQCGLTVADLRRLKNAALKVGLQWRMRYTLATRWPGWSLRYDREVDWLSVRGSPNVPAILHDINGAFYLRYEVGRRPSRLVGVDIENFEAHFLFERIALAETWQDVKLLQDKALWLQEDWKMFREFRDALLESLLKEMP